ncbi:MAG: ATP-binding protein [Bacillota bacterium]
MDRKKFEKMVATCILTAFMGQLYLNPFSTNFRFTLAVTTLTLLLIYFKDISIIATCNAVGIFMFLFRSFVYLDGNTGVTFLDAIQIYYPVAFYYILFGIILELTNIREKVNKPEMLMIYLWFSDSISNIVEAAYRSEATSVPFEGVVLIIIFVGLMRSMLTSFIYYLTTYYMNRYEREQKENKYREMVLFIANLKSELFFLRKSIIDIEEAMSKSFSLYEKLNDPLLKDDALIVAKDIHEVKKDYIRVVSGIEKTLSEENKDFVMPIKSIFSIIKQNTEKLIATRKKNIILQFKYKNNFQTKEFYPLISVLNNLIINGIDAIDDVGVISIEQNVDQGKCNISIKDTGKGINGDDLDLIFEPGFSTKFNEETGEMSTGIGLTHVKHIIENHFQGNISVASETEKGTKFTISIPLSTIMYRKW